MRAGLSVAFVAALSVGAPAMAQGPAPGMAQSIIRPGKPLGRTPPPVRTISPARAGLSPAHVGAGKFPPVLSGPVSLTPGNPEAPGATLTVYLKDGWTTEVGVDGTKAAGVSFFGAAGEAYAIHCVYRLNVLATPSPGFAERATYFLDLPGADQLVDHVFVLGGGTTPTLINLKTGKLEDWVANGSHVIFMTPRLKSGGQVNFTFRPEATTPDYGFDGCDIQPTG